MSIEAKVAAAKKAIAAVYSDLSVSAEDTRGHLEDLQADIDSFIDAINEGDQRDAGDGDEPDDEPDDDELDDDEDGE